MSMGFLIPAERGSQGRLALLVWLAALCTVGFLVSGPTCSARAEAPRPVDKERVEAFFEGLIRGQQRAFHTPGAAVVMVQDGRVVLSRGWGLADPVKGLPFDPERSVFQAGSLSKVFTDMAILQLHEKGLLDLNADIRTYLGDFDLKTEYPQPLSLAHLMTHTGGFEFSVDGIMTRDATQTKPLAKWLIDHRRIQVRPPGLMSAYNNYDHTLAGFVVERVTGLPFAEYVARNILEPLGMTNSSFRQPVPPDLASRMVQGHTHKNDRVRPLQQGTVQIIPAGGLTTSSLDMAGFMIALLQKGRLGENRILRESTAEKMLEAQFRLPGRLGGLTYGLDEILYRGQRGLYHGGYLSGTYTVMLLLPRSRIGLLAVYNCESGLWGIADLLPIFMEYLFPDQSENLRPKPYKPNESKKFSGYYLPTAFKGSSFEGLLIPVVAARLKATSLGTLIASWDLQARPKEMARVGEKEFHQIDGMKKLFFLDNGGALPDKFYFSARPTITFERLPWYETPPFQVLMITLNGLIFLTAIVLWPFFLRPGQAGAEGRVLSRAGLIAALGSSVYLIMAAVVITTLQDAYGLAYGFGPFFRLALKLPYAGAAASFLTLPLMILAWRQGSGRTGLRILYSLATFSLCLFTSWLIYWRMF